MPADSHCITVLISFPAASARLCCGPCVATMLLHSFMVSDCSAAVISIRMRSYVACSMQLSSLLSMPQKAGSYSRVAFAISSLVADAAPIMAPYLGHMRRLRCPSGVGAMLRCFAAASGSVWPCYVSAAIELRRSLTPS